VEVRCYNPPRLDQPLGWIGRDHRKCLVVDGEVAFVTGLCVGSMWEGVPERGRPGWRDTGVEVRGPAVADVAHAFADTWAATGAPLPPDGGRRARPWPRLLAWPFAAFSLWLALALIARAARRRATVRPPAHAPAPFAPPDTIASTTATVAATTSRARFRFPSTAGPVPSRRRRAPSGP
jgi:phosphatidylserine/phosphatidylglycerophosphate/cardiolipin synthase-like enzyme